jgi:hypothetical protein
MASDLSIPRLGAGHAGRLTKRWSEALTGKENYKGEIRK